LRTAPARGKRKIGRPTFLCSRWKQPCDYGFCFEFRDVAESFAASYEHHPVDDLESLDDDSNAYRATALECLNVLLEVDEFMSSSKDGVRDWVSVSIVLGLPSTRGLSSPQIAGQFGCTEKALNASTARFLRLAGLDPAGDLGNGNPDRMAARKQSPKAAGHRGRFKALSLRLDVQEMQSPSE